MQPEHAKIELLRKTWGGARRDCSSELKKLVTKTSWPRGNGDARPAGSSFPRRIFRASIYRKCTLARRARLHQVSIEERHSDGRTHPGGNVSVPGMPKQIQLSNGNRDGA